MLAPADERPVHVRYPTMLSDIVGAQLTLPPSELLPRFREAAPTAALAEWLRGAAASADVLIVSLEALCHGGMIPSRLTSETIDVVLPRLGLLRELRANPGAPRIDASGFVTRLPELDDATEEPAYWADHGRDLGRLSRIIDRAERGDASAAELAAARAAVPTDHVNDVLRRRARNHAILLGALELAADGTLDSLVLSSDDTAPEGLPAREARWLEAWSAALDLRERVHHHAGADEVASVRTVHWLRGHRERPRIALLEHHGLERIAPYEARPIRGTAHGQVRAIGGTPVDHLDDAEVVLAITPPERDGDWALAPPTPEPEREQRQAAFADRVADLVEAGRWVAVADCSEPNGGSLPLVRRLAARGVLARLGGYAGWNTAGNSIGSALAQAVAGRGRAGPGTPHERLLVHRLVEDVGYQTVERTALRRRRRERGLPPEPSVAELPAVESRLADDLQNQLDDLGPFHTRWRIDTDAVRLPWNRTFECDLAIVPIMAGGRDG